MLIASEAKIGHAKEVSAWRALDISNPFLWGQPYSPARLTLISL